MKIDSENIEALIVDYFDGSLNPQQSQELQRAIAHNPEFRELFNEYRSAMDCRVGETTSEALEPKFANELKRTSDFNDDETPYFDRLAVLVNENIATESERDQYNQMVLESDENLRSAILYSKCKIQSNKDLQCPYKQQLKHSRIRPLWYAMAAAAAVSAFFFGIRVLNAPDYNIDAAYQAGAISANFSGRQVSVTDASTYEIAPIKSTKPNYVNVVEPHQSQKEPLPVQKVELLPVEEVAVPLEISVATSENPLINYPDETMEPLQIDWENVSDADSDNQRISMDFIGEQGIAELREGKERVVHRFRERRNPKICVSYDDDGKKDGVSLLIGGRELRVWSR